MLYFKMQMLIDMLICLNFLSNVHGFFGAPFPQSCESMLPEHKDRGGNLISPKNTEPPFEVYCKRGNEGEPITVFLRSKQSITFRGFMLEARETGMVNEGRPVGKFIMLDSKTQLQTCNGLPDSAAGQRTRDRKSLVQVNWTSLGEELDITFRATFVQTFGKFWERVDFNVILPTTNTTTSTTKPSTTGSAKPSTITSATKPSTTSATKPSTTTSATKPSTTSATKPSTTTSSTKLSTTESSPKPTKPCTTASTFPSMYQKAIILMCVALAIKPVEMELLHIVNILSHLPFHLNKGLKITSSAVCAVLEILAVMMLYVGGFHKVTLVAFVFVAIVINIIELVIVSLPFGPSHELKESCDFAAIMFCVIHEVFAIVAIFVGIFEIDDCRKNGRESWLLKVMIAYTAWILVFAVWLFVFTTHREKILSCKIGSCVKMEQPRKKKKLHAVAIAVIAVSVIIIVGAISFTAAVIGIFASRFEHTNS